jgi:hypothetical protein
VPANIFYERNGVFGDVLGEGRDSFAEIVKLDISRNLEQEGSEKSRGPIHATAATGLYVHGGIVLNIFPSDIRSHFRCFITVQELY